MKPWHLQKKHPPFFNLLPLFILPFYTPISKRRQITCALALQKRQILVTVVEILLPLLFSCILIVLRQKVPFKDYPNATVYGSFNVNQLPWDSNKQFQLAYVPGNSSVVRQVAEEVRGSLRFSAGGSYLGSKWVTRIQDTYRMMLACLKINYKCKSVKSRASNA